MKVTSVSLHANEEEAIRFDLRNVSTQSPYKVRAMVGLDADELIPKFYAFGLNGKKFYDFGLKPRDVVIRIALNPRYKIDESVSFIRDRLYRAISATRTGLLELQFHAGASTPAHVYGFFTKFEVPYFNKTPEVQITLRCTDPMLRGINPIIMEAADLPSSGIVIVPDSTSTAPHGFHMSITFTASETEFVVQDRETDPEWIFRVVPPTAFLAGDVLHFSSEFTNKFLYRVRTGVTTHLMNAVEPTSVWPVVFPGPNELWFNEIASFDWNFIQFDTAFWGV